MNVSYPHATKFCKTHAGVRLGCPLCTHSRTYTRTNPKQCCSTQSPCVVRVLIPWQLGGCKIKTVNWVNGMECPLHIHEGERLSHCCSTLEIKYLYRGWTSCTPTATERPTHPIVICYLLQPVVTPSVCCTLCPPFSCTKMHLKSFSEMLFFTDSGQVAEVTRGMNCKTKDAKSCGSCTLRNAQHAFVVITYSSHCLFLFSFVAPHTPL